MHTEYTFFFASNEELSSPGEDIGIVGNTESLLEPGPSRRATSSTSPSTDFSVRDRHEDSEIETINDSVLSTSTPGVPRGLDILVNSIVDQLEERISRIVNTCIADVTSRRTRARPGIVKRGVPRLRKRARLDKDD